MSTVRRPPTIPAPVIVGLVLAAALAAGRFIASGRIGLSVAILIGIPFFVIVFQDLALAIAVWVALLFIADLSVLSIGPTVIELLLFLAWLAVGGSRRGRLPVLLENTSLITAIALYALWLGVSAAWAPYPGASFAELATWGQSMIMFLVVATTLTGRRDIRVVVFGFVAGAVISVAVGLLGYGGPTSAARVAAVGNRLTGGGGDPNYQASAFIAAMFLAAGLVSVVSSRRAKSILVFTLAFIAVGFIATESRGGLVALVFAAIAAVILLPGQRRQILGSVSLGGLGVIVWVLVRHDALKRITNLNAGTSGRHDQWTVAWRIFKQHVFTGAGLGNFQSLEPKYVLLPGKLSNVHLVAESPEAVHNAYLQLLAENGLIGLVLFLTVAFLSLRCAWRAGERFEAGGDQAMAILARVLLVGTIGMLAANFFITDIDEFRLWILFALGPVLLTVANQRGADRSQRVRSDPGGGGWPRPDLRP